MSDVLLLSRFQFAITIFYHFLFVPLTIGLVILVACMETQYARTLNPTYRKMANFWGKLFTINFVMGIITGITMEFQFGTNWSEYSKYMGDILIPSRNRSTRCLLLRIYVHGNMVIR